LQDELARGREAETREQQLDQLVKHYRDPLLLAAFDLQSRLFNIVRRDFFAYFRSEDVSEREYALTNTLFVLAQFFGWVEALRVDVQFLDLGQLEPSRQLRDHLDAVRQVLATDRLPDRRLRVFWGQQRAIGELMMCDNDKDGSPGRQCLGYAAFTSRLDDGESFGPWLSKLRRDLVDTAASKSFDPARLMQTQHALIDLINFLDDPPVRFPQRLRTKA
jgi:hypothetical protein